MQAKKTVYFTASLVGKKHFLDNYTKIISYLKSKNFDVISDHIITVTPEEVDHSSQEAFVSGSPVRVPCQTGKVDLLLRFHGGRSIVSQHERGV
jgi:hypothetical protein